MIELIPTFVFFFAVIDPIGTVPVYIAVTSSLDDDARRLVARKAILTSAGILIFFMIGGELILAAMDVPLAAFQIAGGIVLFLFAMTMIFGESKPEEEIKLAKKAGQIAVYPLAVPSIASPGAMMAAVLLTENASYNIWEQVQTAAMMVLVLLVVFVLMLAASRVHRLIGDSGASIVSRVMGLILASVAAASTLDGIKEYFGL